MKRLAHALLFATAAALARILHLAPRRRSSPARPVRSLWAGTPIINMATNARAEREHLGVHADSLVFETFFITRAFTYDLSRRMRNPLLRAVLPYAVLVWASRRYDRFHFYCSRGILTPRRPFEPVPGELRLLRSLGKELFFWTYGSDVRTMNRTQSLGPENCCLHCPNPGRACVCDDDEGARRQDLLAEVATARFAMGDMIEYAPGAITDVYFWPVDLDADDGRRYRPALPDPHSTQPLRIVHASNHRHFKGTQYLIDAVESLRARGVAIELDLVERVPNAEALERYRAADVIFDQCLIGFHGFLAQEAMALGKPVICFIRKPDQYLLAPDECPIVNARVHELADVIAELAANRPRLYALGAAGRAYIERHHTPRRFAERLNRAYESLGTTTTTSAASS